MNQGVMMVRDTRAWQGQVTASFFLAALAAFIGVWSLPSGGLERTFLGLGLVFCLFATLTLAKTIRDNQYRQVDTQAWVFVVWAGFVISIVGIVWGLMLMSNLDAWQRGYMIVSWLFLVSSAFTLAKMIRDRHEIGQIESNEHPLQQMRPVPAAS